MISKKLIIPMAGVAIIGAAGLYGVQHASATSSTNGQTLVERIASTFGLDKAKVQAVFDQNKTDKQQNRETTYEQRLTQAVTDKKLTLAQKDAILAEHKKLETELAAAAKGTDRRAATKTVRTEATTWASDNNVSASWLIAPGRMRGGHMGMMGQNSSGADTSTPAQ